MQTTTSCCRLPAATRISDVTALIGVDRYSNHHTSADARHHVDVPIPTDARRHMTSVADAGAEIKVEWFRYLVTRYEPTDIPQAQMVGFMQSMFAQNMLKNHVLKSTAISDAASRSRHSMKSSAAILCVRPMIVPWKASMP